MNIVWSPTARRRSRAAVAFIARDRPMASVEWLDGLARRIELLRNLPEQGRVVPEWGEPNVREVIHEPYRIVYELFDDRIEILTLNHVRQELPAEKPRRSS